MLKKLIALTACLIATNAIAQQAIVINKNNDDIQFTYDIGFFTITSPSEWISVKTDTIDVIPGKYSIIEFPIAVPGRPELFIKATSAISESSSGKYGTCTGGNDYENVSFVLDDMNSPIITCASSQYLNDVK